MPDDGKVEPGACDVWLSYLFGLGFGVRAVILLEASHCGEHSMECLLVLGVRSSAGS